MKKQKNHKYRVTLHYAGSVQVEVQAENEEEAIELAREQEVSAEELAEALLPVKGNDFAERVD